MSTHFPPEPLAALAAEIATLLKERVESVCVAETAGGGLISSAILSQPGASKIYKGSVVIGSNLLGVFGLTAVNV
jgi:nicotinamide mononucleotide (NMN) deamidase PncC